MLTTRSSQFEKPNFFEILLMTDFFMNFLKYQIFRDFCKSSSAVHAEIIVDLCVLFHMNMAEQTEQSLISHSFFILPQVIFL